MSKNIIDNSQILEAYKINKIEAKFKIFSSRDNPIESDKNKKEAFLYLLNDSKEILKHCCIHNEYILEDKEGKYVRLNNITLKDEVKASKEKIGKKIIHQNREVYKRNGFNRIVLRAIHDGVVAWKKIGFDFDNPIDEKLILKQLTKYLVEIKLIKENNKFTSLDNVSRELFFDKKINFTDWLKLDTSGFHMTLRIKDVK